MELRHLRYFVTVAEELNFRRAAERLSVSQPPLSTQIKTLESELSVPLFERSNRGIKLTAAGQVFLEHARTVLAAAETARQSARHAGHGLVGTLRIGIALPILTMRLARNILSFRKKYPAVQLFMQELTTAEQIQRLQNDQLDIGLMRAPVGFAGLESRYIEEWPLLLAVPKGHRFVRQRLIRWTDFRDEPMVMLQPNLQFGLYDDFLRECAKNSVTPLVSLYANNGDTLFWLVAAGLGVSLVSDLGARYPGVVFCKLPVSLPLMKLALAWKQSNRSPPLANFLKNLPRS